MNRLDSAARNMDRRQILRNNYHRLISMGYGETLAWATALALLALTEGTSQLTQFIEGHPNEGLIEVSGYADVSAEQLLHNDMLPEWEKFAAALASISKRDHGTIQLLFKQVPLHVVVWDMLLRAFKTAPIEYLMLSNNGLGREGTSFAVECLKVNMTLETLDIRHHRIESECDAKSLAQTVIGHPQIRALKLINCGVGQSNAIMRAIVPTLDHLTKVGLQNNSIGSFGISLISSCLASNPDLQYLYLDNNPLRDEDAIVLAGSLKTNSKLRKLGLTSNRFTVSGIYAVLNLDSLDAAYESNRTCRVDDGGELLPFINAYLDPQVNRKLKIHRLLPMSNVHAQNIANMQHITDIPIGTVPRVIGILQGVGVYNPPKHNGLNSVFTFMREWSMPLLYMSRVGPNLRRSERIRVKKLKQLMQN